MSDYPRHLIRGTLEHEQYINDSYKYGWISRTNTLELLKQKLCKHHFSLWCTNQGIQDTRTIKYRMCFKCGLQEEK